jgi:CBS domain-containing protein
MSSRRVVPSSFYGILEEVVGFPFKQILCPIDFDENAVDALTLAAQLALQHDGEVLVLHSVPSILPAAPSGLPGHVDAVPESEGVIDERLKRLAGKCLEGVKYELSQQLGDPAAAILRAERQIDADVVVMATHGRRGFSRVFLGSVAEKVLRESRCPVLTVRGLRQDRDIVGYWMTRSLHTASPNERLSSVGERMYQGGFRSMPVVDNGKLVGIISDRDLRKHVDLAGTEVRLAMTHAVLTVTSRTFVSDVARLLLERKIGGIPVVDDGELVGTITTTDLLGALIERLD